MKLRYYKESDSLYIDHSPAPSADSLEISDHLVVDDGEDGSIVGLAIQHASLQMDLTSVDLEGLPLSVKSLRDVLLSRRLKYLGSPML